jgi:hypothetical protein
MYLHHDIFDPPKDLDAKIWRYMDFTKLLSLIDNQSLYFSRADKFGDQFEGSLTLPVIKHRNSHGLSSFSEAYKEARKYTYINCWHVNDYESEAMWKLFVNSNESIAVQSTYNKLKMSLDAENTFYVFIGLVKYIDYKVDIFNYGNVFSPFLFKRKSFEHEKELRAIASSGIDNPGLKCTEKNDSDGLNIKVNLDLLIETIFINPTAPDWFYELVKSVTAKYKFHFEVRNSTLKSEPLF